MKKENDKLFNLFRSRLEHAEMPVRDSLWAKLENEIPVVLHNRRKIIMRRFAVAASVLLILGGASAAFWYISPKDEIADAFKEVVVSTGTKGTIEKDGVITELPPLPIASTVTNPVKQLVGYQYMDEVDEESFSISLSMFLSFTKQYGSSWNDIHAYARKLINTSATTQEEQQETTSFAPVEEKRERKWSIGVYASSSPAVNSAVSRGLQTFANTPDAADIADLLPEEDKVTRIKHKLPVSVGVSVKRELSKKFALETGVIYTQLNSELSAGGKETYYSQDQKLHYIGIPLKAGYTFLDKDHLDLYAVAGGMVEKCVSGRVKTDYYVEGQRTHSARNSIKADPLQLSLMAALGIQYKFNDRISVYAEPGLSYHFDDGSPVNTIRKERPLNFNLLCGVRMTY